MKQNCWEIKKCGREQNGVYASKLGVCPAATETRLNGVHGGQNAGRACWVVAGTLCGGEVEGTFAKKFKDCEVCVFYDIVRREEFPHFLLSIQLLRKLNG